MTKQISFKEFTENLQEEDIIIANMQAAGVNVTALNEGKNSKPMTPSQVFALMQEAKDKRKNAKAI